MLKRSRNDPTNLRLEKMILGACFDSEKERLKDEG